MFQVTEALESQGGEVVYDGTRKGSGNGKGVLGRWLQRPLQDGKAGRRNGAGPGAQLGREICDPEDKLILEPTWP